MNVALPYRKARTGLIVRNYVGFTGWGVLEETTLLSNLQFCPEHRQPVDKRGKRRIRRVAW